MSRYLVVTFPDEGSAYQGTRALSELHGDGSLTLYGAAVLEKDADGKVSVKEAQDEGPVGVALGMLVGGMIGIFGGPAGVALGATGGALLGAVGDITNAGVGLDFVDAVGDRMGLGTYAVVAEVDEYWTAPVDTRMEAIGGVVFRRSRTDFTDQQFEAEVAAWNAEMAELKAEWKQAADDAKAKLQAKMDETRANLEAAQAKAKAKIEEINAEAKAKIKELEDQAARVSGEAKVKIEERIAEVRADYDARAAKLGEAWDLTKEALTA